MDKRPSKKKTEANRANAKKSTGPKDSSVTRYNAMKHGILSREILLDGEDRESLEQLGKRLRRELAPAGEMEQILVDRIISSTWRLRRVLHVETEFLEAEFADCSVSWMGGTVGDTKAWNSVVSRELGKNGAWLNLTRYETTIEKQIYKALHELIRLQAARNGEKPSAPMALDIDISGQ